MCTGEPSPAQGVSVTVPSSRWWTWSFTGTLSWTTTFLWPLPLKWHTALSRMLPRVSDTPLPTMSPAPTKVNRGACVSLSKPEQHRFNLVSHPHQHPLKSRWAGARMAASPAWLRASARRHDQRPATGSPWVPTATRPSSPSRRAARSFLRVGRWARPSLPGNPFSQSPWAVK